MKVDIDAFLSPRVFKCLLVQVTAVLPLEQKPVFYPQGMLLPCPSPPGLRAEGVSGYTLHKPRLLAAHKRLILPPKLTDF